MLVEAIASALEQTYRDIEVIVVDDGSTDDTEERIARIADDRLRYFKIPHAGRSAARNRAIEISRGEYIAFLDSDDLFLPEKIAKQVMIIDAFKEIGLVYTSAFVEHVNDPKQKEKDHVLEAKCGGNLYQRVLLYSNKCAILLPSVMMRRSLFDKSGYFDEEMSRLEDFDLWRRIARYTLFQPICEPLVRVRIHLGNTSELPKEFKEAIDNYTKKVFREESSYAGRNLIRMRAAEMYFVYYEYLRYLGSPLNPYRCYFLFKALYYHLFSKMSMLWQSIRLLFSPTKG
jgi:glycosyltransferase involved in cell wall biosynthesis